MSHADDLHQQGGRVTVGKWGGPHVRLDVRAAGGGADIEYDCAHGTIDGPLELDDAGRFDARGTHIRERPGPTRLGEEPDTRPARYTGEVDGRTMTLRVKLSDPAEELGPFTLEQGRHGRLWKCL